MGNIATPNTPYCLGFQQASLSVGSKTFSTQNPPISYAIDGSTVTVFDALGVIGITPYSSDDFVEISSSPASPNTNYCSSAKAILSWSSGTVETFNPPISYQLRSNIVEWGSGGVVQGVYNAPTAINNASIQNNANKLLINGQIETFNQPVLSWQNIPQSRLQIDWGGGDIQQIEGSSGSITKTTENLVWRSYVYILRFRRKSDGLITQISESFGSIEPPQVFVKECSGFYRMFAYSKGYAISPGSQCGESVWSITSFKEPFGTPFLNNPFTARSNDQGQSVSGHDVVGSPTLVNIAGGNTYTNITKTTVASNAGATAFRWGNFNPTLTTIQVGCILRVAFENGTTQDLSYPTCPTVQSIPGCTVEIVLANSTTENIPVNPCPDFVNVINNEVTVFDNTGQIFKADYATLPLNFQVTCYDFNVAEVSYACQGDCPSGTEFRCVCPATNTIMCYSLQSNVFKPVFITQITS